MEISLGVLLLAFIALIEFCESHQKTCLYRGRRFKVTFNTKNGLPIDFELLGDNPIIPHHEQNLYFEDEYLEFEQGIGFFFVTTMNRVGHPEENAWVVGVRDADSYNLQSLKREKYKPHERFRYPDVDATILVFRQTGSFGPGQFHPVEDVRFEGMNVRILHPLARLRKVELIERTHKDIRVRLFKLQSGKFIGVELA